MQILHSIAEMRDWRDVQSSPVGFVPTMGALHAGHASLLQGARAECERVCLSIFVNPLQFGPNEDYHRYPRVLEADLDLASHYAVDAVFLPAAPELVPEQLRTQVSVAGLSEPFCGPFRPGHFAGVATIVLKLFHLVQPDRAYFGLKDIQQFLILRQLVDDLDLRIQLVGLPTQRDAEGLALSSRNRYLVDQNQRRAPMLYRELCLLQELLPNADMVQWKIAVEIATRRLGEQGFRLQYLEARRFPDLGEMDSCTREWVIAVAAYLGQTRLIDNVMISHRLSPKGRLEF